MKEKNLIKLENQPIQENTSHLFFENNKNLPLSISNQEFQKIIEKNEDIFVLDAREDEEFEIGSFPNSKHIRFADILNGDFQKIPSDKIVYVFCWSGIRGKEIVEFLRSKKITAKYIEKGAEDWVKFKGQWNGEINFSAKYSDPRYKKIFTLEELKNEIKSGTQLVDTRASFQYEKWHIPESINIPIIHTPSTEIKGILSTIPQNQKIITICDDFVSCFDAKITAIKLEKNGHIFLGRYNKPWEFRNNPKL